MRYQGSEALNMNDAELRADERVRAQQAARSFSVVQGDGLDARARRGVSAEFLARVKVCAAVAAFLLVLGFVRVNVTTATVTLLQGNAALRTDIKQAQALNDELQVEHSVLSSASRISRIAVQNYGMVMAEEHDVLVLSGAAEPSDGDAAQSVEEATQAPAQA